MQLSKLFSGFFILLITSQTINAEETGFYAGGSLGLSSIDIDSSDLNATLSNVDDEDLGWKIFAGYTFNKYLGFEVAYVDLGEISFDFSSNGATGTASADLDGVTIAGVARYPVTPKLDVFGKVGAFIWNAEASASATLGTASASLSDDDNGESLIFGFGSEYEITDAWGVRAEWERYDDVDEESVDLFTIGVEYDF